MSRIVILDGHTANPGDLSWERLSALGEVKLFERTPPELVVEHSRGARVVLTNKVALGAAELAQLPELELISVTATGTNVVDLEAARTHGVVVTNVPAYSTASTAQHSIALLLELCHHVGRHSRSVHDGKWAQSKDFCFAETPLIELDALTLGVVGLGAIGLRVARIAEALGMRVVAHTRTAKPDTGITHLSKAELLETSDVVSLHCPLTPETYHFIDESALRLMKPSAFLLNVARGDVLDEVAVAAALREGRLAGLGADTLSREPPPPDHPLLGAPRTVLTPHQAWATRAARTRLIQVACDNVEAFLKGTPRNVVGP